MPIQPKDELNRFNCLYKELDDIYHEMALKTGLSDSAFCVMYMLVYSGGGCLQKDIAAWYSISRQTINSSIKKLLEQGLITLQPGKGREMHLYLTPAGEKFAREKIEPLIQKENQVFMAMKPQEWQELLRLTTKLVELYKKHFDLGSRSSIS